MELRKFVAPEFILGNGARHLVGQYAHNYQAGKVLLVTDPGVMACGWVDDVLASLAAYRVPVAVFTNVSPNPRDLETAAGVAAFNTEGCDVIVAVGGGSPIDCAKGIGIAASGGADVGSFEGVDRVSVPAPPLICVPTTAGTAADVSQFAIITDTRRKVKMAIVSKSVVPDVALIDPETTFSMPAYLTACTGMDVLCHAAEAYVSTAHGPITDQHALAAIGLVAEYLPRAVAEPANAVARQKMTLASLLAGLAFSNASLGAVHAVAHSLGGLLDMPHGECNALLLESVVEYNYSHAADRYDQIGRELGAAMDTVPPENRCERLVGAIRSVRTAVGITGTVGDRGMTAGDVSQLAANALKDACMVTNPRRPAPGEIEELIRHAL